MAKRKRSGVWDKKRECWISSKENPDEPASYPHPFFAKGILDWYAGIRWEQEGRYEVRTLPSDTSNLPLTNPRK